MRYSPRAFRLQVMRALRSETYIRSVHPGDDDLAIQVFVNPSPELLATTDRDIDPTAPLEATHDLTNFYAPYQVHGDFQHEIDRIIGMVRDTHGRLFESFVSDLDRVRDRIYPKLEVAASIEAAEERAVGELARPLRRLVRPWNHGLAVCYVIDSPTTVLYLTEDHRNQYDVDLRDLHRIAMDNLVALAERTPWDVRGDRSGVRVCVVETNDGYDATRLLAGAIIREQFPVLRGTLCAVAPRRDFLAIADVVTPLDRQQLRVLANLQRSLHPDYGLTNALMFVPRDNFGCLGLS